MLQEPRGTVMSLELIQEGNEKTDPLDIAWADKWYLSDLINHLGLRAYTSTDVINNQMLKEKPDEVQIGKAARSISNATQAIRALSVRRLFEDDEPKQITFVYMGAMYGVTAIKDSK